MVASCVAALANLAVLAVSLLWLCWERFVDRIQACKAQSVVAAARRCGGTWHDADGEINDPSPIATPVTWSPLLMARLCKRSVSTIHPQGAVLSYPVFDYRFGRDDASPVLTTAIQEAKEAANDSSMVGGGVDRIFKSRYDSISTYLHYCKRHEENPMHVLDVSRSPRASPSQFPGFVVALAAS